jgi:hypothetical protein
MKILIIGNINSPFMQEYLRNISGFDTYSVDFISISWADKNRIKDFNVYFPETNFLEKLPLFNAYIKAKKIKSLINKRNVYYDVIHLHFVHFFYFYLTKTFSRYSNKLVLTYWGGDIHFSGTLKFFLLKKLRKNAYKISLASSKFKEKLLSRSNNIENKINIVRFGLKALEELKKIKNRELLSFKEKYEIPQNKIILTIGTNALENQQHIESRESIKASEIDPNSIHFIFPLTYGRDGNYLKKLMQKIKEISFSFTVFNEYLKFSELLLLVKVTNIAVQLQKFDQLSGSMQEHLFAGNYVITGDWLPYDILDEHNVFYKKISSVSDVGVTILNVVRMQSYKNSELEKNAEIIWNLSSWEKNLPDWLALYK